MNGKSHGVMPIQELRKAAAGGMIASPHSPEPSRDPLMHLLDSLGPPRYFRHIAFTIDTTSPPDNWLDSTCF